MSYTPRMGERYEEREHYTVTRSAMASIRVCKYCKHSEIYKYTGGHRGAGMVGGNKANGRMIQHLKAAHPDKYPTRV